jgi:hypothetical protein
VFAFLTRLLLPLEKCFINFDNHELAGGTTIIQKTIVPYWTDAIRFAAWFVTPSPKKMMATATDSLMTNLSSVRESH